MAGRPNQFSLENRLFNSLTLINGLANLFGSFNYLNLEKGFQGLFIVSNENILFIIHLVSGVCYLVFYLMARLQNYYRHLYWPFLLVTISFLITNFIFDAGTQGGAHYYLITLMLLVVILSPSNLIIWLSSLVCLGVTLLLFCLEFQYPEWIKYYSNTQEHFINVTPTFLFMQIFNGVLVLILRTHFNEEKDKSERLLLNILPEVIAEELKMNEYVKPTYYESATTLFTDFVGFTKFSENMTPQELVETLDEYFVFFDSFALKNSLEKIKIIGDSYMAVGGLPQKNNTHFIDAVLAALEIRKFVSDKKMNYARKDLDIWDLRIGIHTGPVVAGVIGKQKFAYDVWGDTVNVASRMEATSEAGKINISSDLYNKIKDYFLCTHRGELAIKNRGKVDMYYLERLKPIYSSDLVGVEPNRKFWIEYENMKKIK